MTAVKISIIIIYGDVENTINDFVVSLENQTFKEFEAVFVNCNSNEDSIKKVSELTKNVENFHILTLPYNNDYDFAKNSALGVSSGNYVYFIDASEKITPDYIANIYFAELKQISGKIKILNNKLYKRSFIENNTDINEIIKIKTEEEAEKIFKVLAQKENDIKTELADCYKNFDNTINNKVYDLSVRCSALEKLIYEKEKGFNEQINKFFDDIQNQIKENNNYIMENIRNYCETQILKPDEKDECTGKVYDEINNNKKYAQKMLEEHKREIYEQFYAVNRKIEEINQEQNIRYDNLKNIIETIHNDINAGIKAIDIVSDSKNADKINKITALINLEDNMNKNFDKIYSYINENNVRFYKELIDFYKEINEKIKK